MKISFFPTDDPSLYSDFLCTSLCDLSREKINNINLSRRLYCIFTQVMSVYSVVYTHGALTIPQKSIYYIHIYMNFETRIDKKCIISLISIIYIVNTVLIH